MYSVIINILDLGCTAEVFMAELKAKKFYFVVFFIHSCLLILLYQV